MSCSHNRIAQVSAKCSDMCCFSTGDIDYDGYVPENVGISKFGDCGDYVTFEYCLDCGQMMGRFPISQKAIDKLRKG